ncbi:MAG: DNA translocase FtsK 4TM domain-containing protein [Alphaproteobacteria bacterium]
MVELRGLAWIAAALALALSLVSYQRTDPSFNRATGEPVHNLLGRPGAHLADLALQSFGLASLLAVGAFALWGLRVALHREPATLWLRLTLLPIGIVLSAAAFAVLPFPEIWPIAGGFGGAIGRLALDYLVRLATLADTSWGSLPIALALTSLAGLVLAQPFSVRREHVRAAGLGLLAAAKALARLPGVLFRGSTRAAESASDLLLAIKRAEQRMDGGAPLVEPSEMAADGEDDEAASVPMSRAGPVVERRTTAPKKRTPKQIELDLSQAERELPGAELLQAQPEAHKSTSVDRDALAQNAKLLESVLRDFGINGEVTRVCPGPVVTLYELEPAPGTKTSRVISLSDDIARSMSAVSARVAVVPGRNVIGIELPNAHRERVYLSELISADGFVNPGGLSLALGKDIGGSPIVADLSRMPHLLIAGTTGSGKSVAINTMILSLLYRLTPEECRLILIDPKMLELSVYDGIPHLLTPVVTDPRKAVVALKWAVREMEERYRAMSQLGVRNIASYNARLAEARRKGEVLMRKVQTGFDSETGKPVVEDQPLDLRPLPFVVIVVDEMADLMLVAGKDIEVVVQRLAQMARAGGIHLLMATQRPSVDVITGTIKANFPTRISFQVTSKIDSRTILGEQGAEQLLGQGDMLYMVGGGRIARVHGPFVSDEEVERVVRFLKDQGEPEYLEGVTDDDSPESEGGGSNGDAEDELYDQAVAIVLRERKASTSFVQRHLQIGYNRAARLIERMESEGVIGAANHVGKREILSGGERAAMR